MTYKEYERKSYYYDSSFLFEPYFSIFYIDNNVCLKKSMRAFMLLLETKLS